jgi:hypothetical protein
MKHPYKYMLRNVKATAVNPKCRVDRRISFVNAVTPIPRNLWPTCAVCGQLLDAWGTCPSVPAKIAASISSWRRPVYCNTSQSTEFYPSDLYHRVQSV